MNDSEVIYKFFLIITHYLKLFDKKKYIIILKLKKKVINKYFSKFLNYKLFKLQWINNKENKILID